MKTSLYKIFSIAKISAAVALSVAVIGCGAKSSNPIEGYEKGVLQHNTPARDQINEECGLSFTTASSTDVIEGGTFKQEIKVIDLQSKKVLDMKSYRGGFTLQGEPKGMSISPSGIVTYVVPRGLVPAGVPSATYEYSVLPASQRNKNLQCATNFSGIVTIANLPQVTIKDAPTVLNLDTPAKSNFSVNGKALNIKSNESITLAIDFDSSLDSSERPILNLEKALEPAKASLPVGADERLFNIELDSAKLLEQINTSKNAKIKKMSEINAIAVITVKNEENKTSYSKNLVIKVTRTLPVAVPKAAPAKAGKK